LEKSLESISTRLDVFVACFSEEGDSLSQWRGYCGRESGFSLGFPSERLQAATGRPLVACVYDWEQQLILLNELLDEILDKAHSLSLVESTKRESLIEYIKDDFALEFVILASYLKHPSFSEEREWRLRTTPLVQLEFSEDEGRTHIRAGRSVLV